MLRKLKPPVKSQSHQSKDKFTSLALRDQLCFALYSASLAMTKLYRGLLEELNITYPQYLVMLVLWENDILNVSAIGERLFLDSATLTPLLKRMEAAGLVSRRRDPEDERNVIVALTNKGKSLKQRAQSIPHCVGGATQCSLEELSSLTRLLANLRENLLRNQ
jgi:MarR family transcriptional regulator, organic hydroperoxide resistance regulator